MFTLTEHRMNKTTKPPAVPGGFIYPDNSLIHGALSIEHHSLNLGNGKLLSPLKPIDPIQNKDFLIF
jgi:hypothetical protein